MSPRECLVEGDAAILYDDLPSELRWLPPVSDALARDELRRAQQS